MRFIEIQGGLQMPASNEELAILERMETEGGIMPRTSFDEREREVARKMVSRGLLNRTRKDEQVYYLTNQTKQILGDPNVN